MPTPRRPNSLRVIDGTLGKTAASRAQRDGKTPKARGELGPPPPYLNAVQATLWRHVQRTAPPGLLCAVDRAAVESWCVLEFARQVTLAEWNRAANPLTAPGERGATTTAPLLRELRRLASMANSFAKELGFTPKSRASLELVTPTPRPADPLAKFLD